MIIAATIFVSAFLLFQIQLILARFLLPWFGGTPMVWTTCMLFFQVLLLLGYAYAHASRRTLAPRRQAGLHAGLLIVSLAVLAALALRGGVPVLAPESWRPATPARPVLRILLVLLSTIGLPFFLLSTTSPLLQDWHGRVLGRPSPYRLYALSNAGSLLGLVSYPFVVEPLCGLHFQARLWTILYALFAAGCLMCMRPVLKSAMSAGSRDKPRHEPDGDKPRGALAIAAWVLLAACGSAMLLSVTNRLCQEVAVVPFLWVLPLVLYLLSYIVCFGGRGYSRGWFVPLCAVLTLGVLITEMLGVRLKIPVHVISHASFLFVFCMTCHGELVRLRPGAQQITLFYLALAAGGALGGAFVGLAAPRLFSGYHEFHVTVLAGWLLLVVLFVRDRESFVYTGDRRQAAVLVLLLAYVGVRYELLLFPMSPTSPLRAHLTLIHLGAALLVAALLTAVLRRRDFMRSRVWPRVLLGTVIFFAESFLVYEVRSTRKGTLAIERNFYGVVRVHSRISGETRTPYLQLTHGRINHGYQYLAGQLRRKPTAYFVPGSGIGLALVHHPRRAVPGQGLRIGVTGLGVGALAAYAGTNDVIRFYEINPAVIDYAAGDEAFFSYLHDCPGQVDVVPGDARLSMERELADGDPQRYDVLVLDAFSSDSVPVHLLTEEAFAVYCRHLRDADSIIAVNISNRFLDLRPVLSALAPGLGMQAASFLYRGDPPVPSPSLWVLLTRNPAFLDLAPVREKSKSLPGDRQESWTDNYSNLFRLLK